MKFIHTADLHLGASPDAGSAYTPNRKAEIWNSFERLIEACEKERADLLLIVGDLFHRQPLLRELKEVGYLLGKLAGTQVVLVAGNHDYLKEDSYYRTFPWPSNVHMLPGRTMQQIEFPELGVAVCGFSYHAREMREKPYEQGRPDSRQPIKILMLHGGDEMHVPFKKEELLNQGYDYIALGHIHKPCVLCPGKMAYCGALEPIDKNDVGPHGYVLGEFTGHECKTRFVSHASREYRHLKLPVSADMTGFSVREMIRERIDSEGTEHIYKIILTGFRDPQILLKLHPENVSGNILEIVDQTRPAYDFEKILRQNQENILGRLIRDLKDYDRESTEYLAMCEGVQALMETRRG